MKARTKSVFIILSTLLVGVLIGSLATSAVINSRLDQLHKMRRPGGTFEAIERVVQPQDEAQREQIRAIVEAASKRRDELFRASFGEIRASYDSMRTELNLVLSDEQQQRLDEWYKRDRWPRRMSRRDGRERPEGARPRRSQE